LPNGLLEKPRQRNQARLRPSKKVKAVDLVGEGPEAGVADHLSCNHADSFPPLIHCERIYLSRSFPFLYFLGG